MKKAILFLLVSVMTLSFNACSSDDDDNGPARTGTEIVYDITYRSGNSTVPDVGATLFSFDRFITYDQYTYVGNGVFKHKKTGEEKKYSQKSIADNSGTVKMKINFPTVVVWQSGNVAGKYAQKMYDSEADVSSIAVKAYFSEMSQPTFPH